MYTAEKVGQKHAGKYIPWAMHGNSLTDKDPPPPNKDDGE